MKRNQLRWNKDEVTTVVNDWTEYDNGHLLTRTLKERYQGRSIPAIREKARVLALDTTAPLALTRKNPVYAAIEKRMVALGYGPEVIKSIISPRKVSIEASLVRSIEAQLSATPHSNGWWFFSVGSNGTVKAAPLSEGQDMNDLAFKLAGIRVA